MSINKNSRRDFLKQTAAVGAALYNVAAGVVGGIEVDVDQVVPTHQRQAGVGPD